MGCTVTRPGCLLWGLQGLRGGAVVVGRSTWAGWLSSCRRQMLRKALLSVIKKGNYQQARELPS